MDAGDPAGRDSGLVAGRRHAQAVESRKSVDSSFHALIHSALTPPRRPGTGWRGPRAPALVWVCGPLREVALYVLIRLLEQEGSEAVRRCPVCGRLTVARRADRRYCSARCQIRDYMCRYRAAGYMPVGRRPKGESP